MVYDFKGLMTLTMIRKDSCYLCYYYSVLLLKFTSTNISKIVLFIKVPLSPESADVAVFCLSLMGTNLVEYLKEAHRVLKLGYVLTSTSISLINNLI